MKKVITLLLALLLVLSLVACEKKPPQNTDNPSGNTKNTTQNTETPTDSDKDPNQKEQSNNTVPEGATSDETKLGESVTYYVDGESLYLKIKTSYEFDAHDAFIDIVNLGFYLTRDSQFITQCIFGSGRDFAEDFDKEWFDGVYVFKLDNQMIRDLAADDSEWAPGIWTMMLYEGESRLVIGQWMIVLEGGGKYHFEFKDSWLRGAGEDRKVKEFDSLEKEVESWFTFKANESYDEWATFNFDGYYLEEIDPQGYDKYYLMVCPEGDYKTYKEADATDLTYGGIGGLDYAKCPYRFAFEQDGIKNGKYTMALAKMGGNVEVQFIAEKISPTEWKMDFSNAKCPALESKYSTDTENPNTEESGSPTEEESQKWPLSDYVKPENCQIDEIEDWGSSIKIYVVWENKDAAKAYKEALGLSGGTVADIEGAYEYNSSIVMISYSETNALANFVIINK